MSEDRSSTRASDKSDKKAPFEYLDILNETFHLVIVKKESNRTRKKRTLTEHQPFYINRY